MKSTKHISIQLQVEYLPAGSLKPYENNTRAHPPGQIDKIIHSIQTVGFTKPIIVDENLEILAGHGAWMAARQIGLEEVPTIVRRGLTEAQKKSYRIADNKLAEGSEWANEILAAEFRTLADMGAELTDTGFSMSDIDEMLNPKTKDQDEPDELEPAEQAISRLGDVWQMGSHRLICGDSTNPDTIKTLMNGRLAQRIFTDPPYGVSYVAPSGDFAVIQGDDKRRAELCDMLHKAFANGVKHSTQDAAWYIWHASSTREDFAKAMRDVGLMELGMIIWVKPSIVLGWSDYRWAHEPCFYASRQGIKPAFHGDRSESTVWRIHTRTPGGEIHTTIGSGIAIACENSEIFVQNAPPKGKKIRHLHIEESVMLSAAGNEGDDIWEVSRDKGGHHPTQKPVELARRGIHNSTQEGDVVLDLFGGGGFTLLAAEMLRRTAHVVEFDPKYADVIVRRWQSMTGQAATHDSDGRTFDAIAGTRTGAETR